MARECYLRDRITWGRKLAFCAPPFPPPLQPRRDGFRRVIRTLYRVERSGDDLHHRTVSRDRCTMMATARQGGTDRCLKRSRDNLPRLQLSALLGWRTYVRLRAIKCIGEVNQRADGWIVRRLSGRNENTAQFGFEFVKSASEPPSPRRHNLSQRFMRACKKLVPLIDQSGDSISMPGIWQPRFAATVRLPAGCISEPILDRLPSGRPFFRSVSIFWFGQERLIQKLAVSIVDGPNRPARPAHARSATTSPPAAVSPISSAVRRATTSADASSTASAACT